MRASVFVTALILLVAVLALPPLATHGQQRRQGARLNRLASLLDEDKAVFGINVNFSGVGNAPDDAMTHAANRDLDLVMYDMEHSPWDVTAMRNYMQFLLDPGAIAKAGDVKASTTIVVRVPAYGRELDKNTWMVKQVLDAGVHGVVFPHIETPEQALTAIRAMRYPQKPGNPNFEPDGIRGSGAAVAARYWGLSVPDYMVQSDIYPTGNLVPWFIIENKLGVANAAAIARALRVKNIRAVLWAGTGDLSASYNNDQQAVAKAVDTVLAAGLESRMPVAMNGSANVKQRMQQGARIFMGGLTPAVKQEAGR
jgi:4-hydroxy-2-oxoheptanedioate aldolase